MQSTDTVVHLRLPRNSVGQMLDGLDVLIEQWEATAAYHRYGEVGDEVIRECSDAEEAESIAEAYGEIAAAIREQLAAADEEADRTCVR